jgi:YidC/Oxa1 family membrane protein insertase
MSAERGPAARAIVRGLRGYQWVRQGRPSACRFHPTCSQYAVEAVGAHGAMRGGWLALRRLSKCRPLGPHGVDLVPPARGRLVSPLIATSGITHTIGTIFQPIFHLFGWLLAFFYGIIPNYAVAITLLTIVIMGALTPFTVKSTKSMMAMQRLQPEIKKLQQKYKGAENRQILNEELMRLYREEGVNPIGGCLPVLLQAPFLIILYSTIRGLTYINPATQMAEPRYIPKTSQMYHDLVVSHGQMVAFGLDLSVKPLAHHASWIDAIPYLAMVAIAAGLQYFQMWQLNNRNRKTGQAIAPQQQMLQRIMPLAFIGFYLFVQAAVVLYMIVSTIIRIITQDVMFRTGVSDPRRQRERRLPAAAPEPPPEELPKGPAPKGPGRPGGNGSRPGSGPPKEKKPPPHPRAKSKRPRKER